MVRNTKVKSIKDLEEGLGLNKEDLDRYVAVKYVIDTNKRKRPYEEPRMTT